MADRKPDAAAPAAGAPSGLVSRPSLLATMAEMQARATRAELDEQAGRDWREVLSTAAGRRAVHWLLGVPCEVMGDVYVPGGADGERHSAYNAGRRFPGLEIIRVAGIRLDGLREFEHGSDAEEDGTGKVAGPLKQRRGRRRGGR